MQGNWIKQVLGDGWLGVAGAVSVSILRCGLLCIITPLDPSYKPLRPSCEKETCVLALLMRKKYTCLHLLSMECGRSLYYCK